MAKIRFAPSSENLGALTGKSIDLDKDYNALELLIKDFFRLELSLWDIQAQLSLASGPEGQEDSHFPIEKADALWPEEMSSWRTIAQIAAEPQNSYIRGSPTLRR